MSFVRYFDLEQNKKRFWFQVTLIASLYIIGEIRSFLDGASRGGRGRIAVWSSGGLNIQGSHFTRSTYILHIILRPPPLAHLLKICAISIFPTFSTKILCHWCSLIGQYWTLLIVLPLVVDKSTTGNWLSWLLHYWEAPSSLRQMHQHFELSIENCILYNLFRWEFCITGKHSVVSGRFAMIQMVYYRETLSSHRQMRYLDFCCTGKDH